MEKTGLKLVRAFHEQAGDDINKKDNDKTDVDLSRKNLAVQINKLYYNCFGK